ncbi:DUF4112 domain-containing protein [Rhizobium sp. 2MFCol3.1]|uniref:DUF4112 domain-containing protein n=1 Tax=Rhizobium sp. 2MFCol3.1 TaxID=1246459 RepID=UPI000475B898|nr:DUF4112 domain-containing protein [Rhizobium sp. 2MFCol3.1]
MEQPKTERSLGADHLRRLRRLSSIASLMDTAVGIPFTRLRIGADSVLGLVPLAGDAAGTLVSLYLVNEARRLGLPREKLARMLGNVGVDLIGGAVPVLGDLFDMYFKSNRRNVDLVLDHFSVSRDDLKRVRRPNRRARR